MSRGTLQEYSTGMSCWSDHWVVWADEDHGKWNLRMASIPPGASMAQCQTPITDYPTKADARDAIYAMYEALTGVLPLPDPTKATISNP